MQKRAQEHSKKSCGHQSPTWSCTGCFSSYNFSRFDPFCNSKRKLWISHLLRRRIRAPATARAAPKTIVDCTQEPHDTGTPTTMFRHFLGASQTQKWQVCTNTFCRVNMFAQYSVVLVPGCTCLTTFLAKAMHLRLHVDVLLWLRSLLAVLLVAMSLLLFVLVLLLLLVLLCAIPAVAAAVCECGCGCSRSCSCTCSCTTTSSSFLLFKFVAVVAVVVVAAAVLVVGHSG